MRGVVFAVMILVLHTTAPIATALISGIVDEENTFPNVGALML